MISWEVTNTGAQRGDHTAADPYIFLPFLELTVWWWKKERSRFGVFWQGFEKKQAE